MTLLRVEGLTVEFPTRRGTLRPVDEVTFEIGKGETLGLVGESGAGKSMTGAALIGLLEPPGRIAGGRVWLDGRRVDNLEPAQLRSVRGRRIGTIFQDPQTSLHPLFTVGHQIAQTIRAHLRLDRASARRLACSLLREVGIPDPERHVDSYPHHLSGGMRQRAVIAMALAAEPLLVVADELTTALDVSIQAQILDLLRRLAAERGMSVLLITHDMGVVAELADRIAVMYAGRIVEIGTVEQVLHRPLHPYTERLMGCIPRIGLRPERLTQIPGSMPRLDAIPSGCAFRPRCAKAHERCIERPSLVPASAGTAACWLHA
jgi:peptide/nickel transport system ATP-binding protein